MTSLPADETPLLPPSSSSRLALAETAAAPPVRAEGGTDEVADERSDRGHEGGRARPGGGARVQELGGRLAVLLPALAYFASGVVLAGHQPADTATETGFLALLGGWALAGAALLAPSSSLVSPASALLATLALWVLPLGPTRGAALGVVLVAAVMGAGRERLLEVRGRMWRAAPSVFSLGLLSAMGGALAVHALLRAGELLPATLGLAPLGLAPGAPALSAGATLAALARVLLPPLLAGGALALLSRRCSTTTVMTTGMATALAAGGFTVTAAVPLLALAAAEVASSGRGERHARAIVSPRALGIAAAVAALALTALRPAAGSVALAAVFASRLPLPWGWLVAAAPLGWGLASGGTEPARLLALAGLPALVPFALVVSASRSRSGPPAGRLVPVLLLGAGGTLLLPPPAGLAAAAALACLELEPARSREGDAARSGDDPCPALQCGWLAFLLAGASLAAGYPWLRPVALDAGLAIAGLPAIASATLGAPVATAVATIAGAVALLAMGRFASRRRTVFLLVVGLAVAVLIALPPRSREVAPPSGVALTGATPQWTTRLDAPVRRLRVISTLADAATLPADTPVATLSLEHEGSPLASWTLRVGHETAEWAADRADLRGSTATATPWWSWLPSPGTFFAHAYAGSWRPSRPLAATRLRIVRASALPPGVTLSLLRVEVTP